MTARPAPDTPADRARREREAQGLPPTVPVTNRGFQSLVSFARLNRGKAAKAGGEAK